MKRALYRDDRLPVRRRHPGGRDLLEALWRVVLFPYRLLAAIWAVGLRAGFGFFEGLFKLWIGLFGLGLLAFLIYGLGRVLLHPLVR